MDTFIGHIGKMRHLIIRMRIIFEIHHKLSNRKNGGEYVIDDTCQITFACRKISSAIVQHNQ